MQKEKLINIRVDAFGLGILGKVAFCEGWMFCMFFLGILIWLYLKTIESPHIRRQIETWPDICVLNIYIQYVRKRLTDTFIYQTIPQSLTSKLLVADIFKTMELLFIFCTNSVETDRNHLYHEKMFCLALFDLLVKLFFEEFLTFEDS